MAPAGFVAAAAVAAPCRGPRAAALCTRRPAWAGARVARRARVARAPPGTVTAAADAVEVSADSFEAEVLQSELPVLVDFYAEWCGPCKLVSPLMSWAASEYEDRLKVVKIDTEKSKEFVGKYGIHGLPTFAVFKGGEAFGVQEGALGKQGLQDYIARHVPELA